MTKGNIGPDLAQPLKKEKNFLFVRLPVLREYLERDLAMPNLPIEYDFERAIDDWVLLCSFVGNDFLPHLPSLEIWEDAIDRLVTLYKNMVYQCNGSVSKLPPFSSTRKATIYGQKSHHERAACLDGSHKRVK